VNATQLKIIVSSSPAGIKTHGNANYPVLYWWCIQHSSRLWSSQHLMLTMTIHFVLVLLPPSRHDALTFTCSINYPCIILLLHNQLPS